jgi:hypothetical protein
VIRIDFAIGASDGNQSKQSGKPDQRLVALLAPVRRAFWIQAMSNEMTEVIKLLKRIARNTDRIASAMECGKKTSRVKPSDDTRVALAVVAIARGASSYQEIADELGVSRCTVSRNPGIRRAMEAAVRDRRPADRESADDFRFENSR